MINYSKKNSFTS